MATRSNIAIENQDGTVSAIYCHYDGYIDGVGKKLYENYTTKEKMEQLITLGDISSLGENKETTVAYHRDRGEKLEEPMQYKTVELYFDDFDGGGDYLYCFTLDGQFLVKQVSSRQVTFLKLVLEGEDVLQRTINIKIKSVYYSIRKNKNKGYVNRRTKRNILPKYPIYGYG